MYLKGFLIPADISMMKGYKTSPSLPTLLAWDETVWLRDMERRAGPAALMAYCRGNLT